MANQTNQQKSSQNQDLISELVSARLFDINKAQDHQGLRPLHIAVRSQKYLLAESLLQCGATVDAKSKNGQTALSMAFELMLPDMVKLLFVYKANLKNARKNSQSALWFVMATPIKQSDQAKKIMILDLILQNGMMTSYGLQGEYYKFCKAILNNDFRALKRLLSIVKDVNFRGIEAESPLEFAVYLNQLNIVQLLLEKGAIPDQNENFNRRSALILSIENKNLKMVELLLKFKADVNFLAFDSGCTPLFLATSLANDFGADVMRLLFRQNVQVNRLSRHYNHFETALHRACGDDFFEGMKLLLKNGAKVDAKNSWGQTPLLFVCGFDDGLKHIKILLRYGASVTAVDDERSSILHLVSDNPEINVLKYVISLAVHEGVDINAKNEYGVTPTHMIPCGNLVEFLKNGADLNIQLGNDQYIDHYCTVEENMHNDLECPAQEYVQRQRFLGYQVENPCFQNFFIGNDLSEFYQRELNELKDWIIAWSPKITLYNVLFMPRSLLVRYSINQNLREAFVKCNNDFESQYPYFGSILNVQYRQGINREVLIRSAKSNLQKVFDDIVPDICSNKIFNYLKNNKLKIFANEKFS